MQKLLMRQIQNIDIKKRASLRQQACSEVKCSYRTPT